MIGFFIVYSISLAVMFWSLARALQKRQRKDAYKVFGWMVLAGGALSLASTCVIVML